MGHVVRRFLFALAGAVTMAALVATVEASAAAAAAVGSHPPSYGALVLADLGVLVPVAALVAVAIAAASIFLEPERAKSLAEHAARVRAQPVLLRSRNAALAPLAILGALAWSIAMAHVGRALLAQGAPAVSGVALSAAGIGAALVIGALVLALLRPLRRALAAGADALPSLVDPIVTGGFALVVAVAVVAYGVHAGDTGGDGGVLGIFGVLKRTELDLRPAVNLAAIAAGAYLGPVAFAARPSMRRASLAALVVAALAGVTLHEAKALGADAATARAVERDAPLGKIALHTIRAATDRDRDGASPWFGGGDCDDRDAHRSPLAADVPDNGVDEDCSGADLHVPAPAATREKPTPPPPVLPPDLNVILITVDTLRNDLGFMGYGRPTSPNLDALAAKSIVFDRMYSLASYTGKSVGPMLIGKYPSETKRDGGHFNTYLPSNVFLAERLKAAGIRTFGGASHWYFLPWSGLSQGMDVWDLSARPAEGQGDSDTSVTSKQLTDAAIRLMKKPENTGGRFFAWFHYFDPHEQYMPHDDAPKFGTSSRAQYDGEVWFTDEHIGRLIDYVASQPWGAKTAIVVTADHGETFGEHNMRWHGYELWEPLVRVPFVVYVPGLAPRRVPVKRSHVDLVPTVLDLMHVPQPDAGELSGESDAPDLTSDEHAERDVLMDMPPGPFNELRHAFIHGPTPGMKLIRFENGHYALFDLANDPDEKDDLASDAARLQPMVEAFQAKRASLHEIVVKPDAPPPQ